MLIIQFFFLKNALKDQVFLKNEVYFVLIYKGIGVEMRAMRSNTS